MRFALRHLTRYTYSSPVSLDPHIFHLTPRQDSSQRILKHDLRITPAPVGFWEGLDAEGNPFTQAWFDGPVSELVVESESNVETFRKNPFGFLIMRAAQHIPPIFSKRERAALSIYLQDPDLNEDSETLQLAEMILEQSKGNNLDFLTGLNQWIFGNIDKIIRMKPGILDPEEVCRRGEGACRDSAELFIACCRHVGIPARFVSGYQAGDDIPSAVHDLHAWAEAYIPGAGWLGFDPTHGLAVTDRHVALAASHNPKLTATALGSFKGSVTESSMDYELYITAE